ncbi:MAG: serine hydrolase [Roseivirga sp.]|nr:serine hydrolase [Roseivirga sp.]
MIRNRFFFSVIALSFFAGQIFAFQGTDFPSEEGGATETSSRAGGELTMVNPADLGIDALALESGIRSIILQALDSGAFPGCQILLAKGGKVFYEESFGYHTYDSLRPVKNSDIYDLASVTKTTAATLSLMKLYDDGLFDPDQTFGHYFPDIAKGKKKDMVMRDVLAHQAGLRAWIPYYSVSRKKNGKYKRNSVSSDSSANFPYRISETGLFLHKDYRTKKIYKMIRKSKVSKDKSYLYSGLSFYLYPELIQRITGKSFDQYLEDEFYGPLSAETVGFNAGERFPLETIVPTEVDSFFRMQTLHGVVHDEGAAMMLGVSGNAGLFANAMDLGKVYQMLLNRGEYAGKRYLKASTVEEFTKCQFCETGNKRGMGFDKPLIEYDEARSSVAEAASPGSFGHSGYTGTFVWADPANDLLFVFLSNRVHPTRDNRKIYSLSVRPRIHTLVYDLLEKGQSGVSDSR